MSCRHGALCAALWGILMVSAANARVWDTRPDTWAAADALGREVSKHEKVGPPRKDRFVGIFYFLWLGEHGRTGPWDITKILAADPDALNNPSSPPWGALYAPHHWGEALFGYYLSDDRWVLRKHAQMLSDAGVDVVIFDVTNQATYEKNYRALCEVWTEVRRDGGKTPQIAFLTPFWDPAKVVRRLYDNFYSKGLYKDLWFIWKGRPLILADPDKADADLRNLFTYRKPQPDYFQGPTGPDQWGWLEKYPQHVFYNSKGEPEQMTVGVAQNCTETKTPVAFTVPDTMGRSWHNGRRDMRRGAVNLGLNFAEQWKRALEVDPEFIFITGWNEWIAGRFDEFNGIKQPVAFVDQFSQEYSRDIEPMKGGHSDNYYYQMVDYIRRFKGAREAPVSSGRKTIRIDGRFGDWREVLPEYRDDIGDTMHRGHPAWNEAVRYTNDTGRNDIVLAKATCDDRNVYFYVKTRSPITPHTDPNWMMLLIRLPGDDPVSGWNGCRFIVNRTVRGANVTCVETSNGGWNWAPVCEVPYRVEGRELELAIPRRLLSPASSSSPLRFDFKWADNTLQTRDPMEFYTNGDTAPNGRFVYRFIENPG